VLREKVSRAGIGKRLGNVPPCLVGIEAGMATHDAVGLGFGPGVARAEAPGTCYFFPHGKPVVDAQAQARGAAPRGRSASRCRGRQFSLASLRGAVG